MREGRAANEIRPIAIETGFQKYPDGSVLFSCGQTRVLCAAQAEQGVPKFLTGSRQGWVTAEYSMLPGSSQARKARERTPSGRSMEIQRIIGRSLRAVVDLEALGDQTVTIDCDVIQADGGTRTASITGAFIALALAMDRLRSMGLVDGLPLTDTVCAVSCGIVKGELLLDLDYSEDFEADVDMNVVMTGSGRLIEIQGTAERMPFDHAQLNQLLDFCAKGCDDLKLAQRSVLGKLYDEIAARHA